MVGCRPEAGFQALKRTPATASPERPVERHRHPAAVAGHDMAALDEARRLSPASRSTEVSTIAHRAAGRALLAQHVPGLQRLAQFQRDAAMMDAAEDGEAELALRQIPFRIEA